MFELKTANPKKAVAVFGTAGVIEAAISSTKGEFSHTISVHRVTNINADVLAEFSQALRAVTEHVASIVGAGGRLRGQSVEVPEAETFENGNAVTALSIFEGDVKRKVVITKFAKPGKIRAAIPNSYEIVNDLPRAIQLAHVASQASDLMKSWAASV